MRFPFSLFMAKQKPGDDPYRGAMRNKNVMAQSEPILTVFYDGACPLCTREIGFYRRQHGARNIRWVDVSGDCVTDLPGGLDRSTALRRFHVVQAGGTLLSGARAFAEVWANLPAFSPLGRLAKVKPVTIVLEHAYRGLLFVRPFYQRLLCWRLSATRRKE